MINNFISYINTDVSISKMYRLNKRDQLKIFKIQHYLLKNLDKKFVGIYFLSGKFTISSTKLKNDFKTIIGVSVFQYFQSEQMKFAKKILEIKEAKIKELASVLGYENASKFSSAFKKINNSLPKDIKIK